MHSILRVKNGTVYLYMCCISQFKVYHQKQSLSHSSNNSIPDFIYLRTDKLVKFQIWYHCNMLLWRLQKKAKLYIKVYSPLHTTQTKSMIDKFLQCLRNVTKWPSFERKPRFPVCSHHSSVHDNINNVDITMTRVKLHSHIFDSAF